MVRSTHNLTNRYNNLYVLIAEYYLKNVMMLDFQ